MKTIIWDWNGTLLDDVQQSVDVMNEILRRYGRPLLRDVAQYRAKFCFPVQIYYERVGLEAALFPVVSHEWMDEYLRREGTCTLRAGALEALRAFQAAGCRQVILSASRRENLLEQMARFPIMQYFDEVLGLTHIYATSKEGVAREWIARGGANPAECVMIGDTQHDAQAAQAMGCRCVLLLGGHQDESTLRATGCTVAQNPLSAAQAIIGTNQ